MTRAAWVERKVERKLGGQHTPLSPKLTAFMDAGKKVRNKVFAIKKV